jgi:protein-serine/threonine kinase
MATTGSISISPVLSSGAGDRRSVIASSPSITSGLTASPSVAFRSFFARRTSYTNLQPSPDPSLSTYDNIGSPLSPVISAFAPSNQPLPVYGEAMDGGDEIRFYVEIARVKHLEGLYCVEVKRMRGGQWGYKAVYDVLIKSLDLGVS